MAKYTQFRVINLQKKQLVPLSILKNKDAYHWKQLNKKNTELLDVKGMDNLLLRCCECGAYNAVIYKPGDIVTCDDCYEQKFEVRQYKGCKEFECSPEPRFICFKKTKLKHRVLLQSSHTNGVWRYEREGDTPSEASKQMQAENGYFACLAAPGETLRVRLFQPDGGMSREYSYLVPNKAIPNPTCTICGTKIKATSPDSVTCPICNSRFELIEAHWVPCGQKIGCTCGNTLVFRKKNSLHCGSCGRLVYFDTKDNAWYYKDNAAPPTAQPAPTSSPSPPPSAPKPPTDFNCVNCGTLVSAQKALCPSCNAEYRQEAGRWTLSHYRRQCPACDKHQYTATPGDYTCQYCAANIKYNSTDKIWYVKGNKKRSKTKGYLAAFFTFFYSWSYTNSFLAGVILGIIAGIFVYSITTRPKTKKTRNTIRHCISAAIAMVFGLAIGGEWLLPFYVLIALVISSQFND